MFLKILNFQKKDIKRYINKSKVIKLKRLGDNIKYLQSVIYTEIIGNKYTFSNRYNYE